MPDLLLTHGYFLHEDPKEMQIMKPYAPLGILYLCSHLRQQGFDVEVAVGGGYGLGVDVVCRNANDGLSDGRACVVAQGTPPGDGCSRLLRTCHDRAEKQDEERESHDGDSAG